MWYQRLSASSLRPCLQVSRSSSRYSIIFNLELVLSIGASLNPNFSISHAELISVFAIAVHSIDYFAVKKENIKVVGGFVLYDARILRRTRRF